METNMTIEELEAKRKIAYASLDVLDEDAGYREMFYAYRQAFELADESLGDAIRQLKIHRDRDQNYMASRYG
jgi:phosphopentomutase